MTTTLITQAQFDALSQEEKDNETCYFIADNNVVVDPSCWNYSTTIDACYRPYESPKRFNCKRCGAPNQIDVCEYCGCAAED